MPGDFDQILDSLYVTPADAPDLLGLSRAAYYRAYNKNFEFHLTTIEFFTKLLVARNSWLDGLKKSKSRQNDVITLSTEEKRQLKRKITAMQASLFKYLDRFESSISDNQKMEDALSLIDHILNTPRHFTAAEKSRISAHRERLNYQNDKYTNLDLVFKRAKIKALEAEIAELEGYL